MSSDPNSSKFLIRYIIVCSFLVLLACKKADTSGVSVAPPPTPPVVTVDTILHKFMPYPVGAGINVRLLRDNPTYRGVVTKEYNSITAENAMKFAALHPSATTYNWTDADEIVAKGRTGRPNYPTEFKRRLTVEACESRLALRNGLNANVQDSQTPI